MEITGDLCGGFDKTDDQQWNKFHVYYCYFVAMVINHWYLNHGMWLVIDLHTHRSQWICYPVYLI